MLNWMKNQISDFSEIWLFLCSKLVNFRWILNNFFFLQNWTNLHERCEMCWHEWKINFQIFSFWDMIIFVLKIVNFRWIFTITEKWKSEKSAIWFFRFFFFELWWKFIEIHFSSASTECLDWVRDPYSSASVGGKNMILQEQEELTKLR